MDSANKLLRGISSLKLGSSSAAKLKLNKKKEEKENASVASSTSTSSAVKASKTFGKFGNAQRIPSVPKKVKITPAQPPRQLLKKKRPSLAPIGR